MPETEKYHHIPVNNKEDFVADSFRTITLSESKGILSVIGKLKKDSKGPTTIHKYLFDINKWKMAEAKKWVKENHKKALDLIVHIYFEMEKELAIGFPDKGILDDDTLEILNSIKDTDIEKVDGYFFKWYEDEGSSDNAIQVIKNNDKTESIMVRKDIPIVKKDEMRKIAYGEVYVPMKADAHKHFMKAEEIELMGHNFMLQSRQMDENHDFIKGSAGVVESFIARKGDPDFVEGAWVLGVKVFSERVWENVKSGKIKGYSLAGVANFGDVKEVPTDWEFDEDGRPKHPKE